MMNINDAYRILGLSPPASPEAIREAYKRMVKRFHPDVAPDAVSDGGDSRIKTVNAAYALLRELPLPSKSPAGGRTPCNAPESEKKAPAPNPSEKEPETAASDAGIRQPGTSGSSAWRERLRSWLWGDERRERKTSSPSAEKPESRAKAGGNRKKRQAAQRFSETLNSCRGEASETPGRRGPSPWGEYQRYRRGARRRCFRRDMGPVEAVTPVRRVGPITGSGGE